MARPFSLRLFAGLGVLLMLAGCAFSAPGVSARVGNGEVLDVDIGNGGRHCPPGHRKKGEC